MALTKDQLTTIAGQLLDGAQKVLTKAVAPATFKQAQALAYQASPLFESPDEDTDLQVLGLRERLLSVYEELFATETKLAKFGDGLTGGALGAKIGDLKGEITHLEKTLRRVIEGN